MSQPPSSPTPPPRRERRVFAWAVLGVVVFALVGLLVTLQRFAALPGEVLTGARGLLRGALTGDVTRRFVSTLPEARDIGPGRLEVAVFDTFETLTETDERSALWNLVPLGTTTVEIRLPVTWRWHVAVRGPWRATVENGILAVEAPALMPSLPPGIHTDRMEKKAHEDWLRFDGQDRLDELERSITPELIQRTRDPRLINAAREEARRSLLQLVGLWLQAEGGADKAGVRGVTIRFADEPPSPAPTFSPSEFGGQ